MQELKAPGLKARVADALIAQSCSDHDVALITRGDFRHFAKHYGLKLAYGVYDGRAGSQFIPQFVSP